jgi:sugar phosphate isomerase/epimerase
VLVESLRECAAHRPSVRLALEPLNRYESRLIHTVEDAVSVLDRVGAENLGILFDTFHANIEEISIRDAIHRAGDRLVHVHLADSNRFVPGYGHLDFAEVWRSLDDVGYDRALVLEPLPRPSTEALLQAGRRLGLVAAAD